MRILLTGSTGQVGRELARALPRLGAVTAPPRGELDLARPDAIREAVRRAAPDLVVNAAAYTDVERAEAEPELARAVNARAPGILAEEAARLGAGIVHFSTDYVFDGRKRGPYVESDPPSPLNVYGETKLRGEEAVRAAGAPHLVFRLSWVYGVRGRNFLTAMLDAFASREVVHVVADQTGCPTWCRTVAEAVAGALAGPALTGPAHGAAGAESAASGGAGSPAGSDPAPDVAATARGRHVGPAAVLAGLYGLYHLAPAGTTTWHGFAEAILETLRGSGAPVATRRVEPIPSAAYPSDVRRPARSVLSSRAFERAFGVRLPGWKGELRRCLGELDRVGSGGVSRALA